MGALGSWPVMIIPFGGAACATLCWRLDGQLHVTALVKARFRMRHGRTMTQLLPEPIDHQSDELAPHVRETDVVITAARAHSPVAVEALAIRLAVYREQPLIDKSLLIYAPRPEGEMQPFTTAAVAGPAAQGQGLLINPRRPGQRASLSPLAADHPERLAALANHPRPDLAAPTLAFTHEFPWAYFQVAPDDQRCSVLRGDEWLILEAMSPSGSLATRLPSARAEVRVYPPGLRRGHAHGLSLRADRLSIDAETQSCTLLWRGSFAVADMDTARRLVLVGGVSLGEGEGQWPNRAELDLLLKHNKPKPPVSAYATTTETEGGLDTLLARRREELEQRAAAVAARVGDQRVNDGTTQPLGTRLASLVAIDHRGTVHLVRDDTPRLTEKGTWEMAPGDKAEDELSPLDTSHTLRAVALQSTDGSRPTQLPPASDDLPEVTAADVEELEDTLSASWHQLDAETQSALRHLRDRKRRR